MTMMLSTTSGRIREIPEHIDLTSILGLDSEGRIVIRESWMDSYAFGLTLCCDAYDKGGDDDIYCRACKGAKPNADAGYYHFELRDGSIPNIDPVLIMSRVP